MFALVYYKGSKSTDVICQSDYKIKFAVGKTVAVTYNSKPFPGKVSFTAICLYTLLSRSYLLVRELHVLRNKQMLLLVEN